MDQPYNIETRGTNKMKFKKIYINSKSHYSVLFDILKPLTQTMQVDI